MKIYVSHSSSFDFQNELYKPIRQSVLNDQHEFILPHESSNDQFNSKVVIPKCDVVIAEVSYPSTGQGIELGWADASRKRIICISKKGSRFSPSLNVVCSEFHEYDSPAGLIQVLTKILSP